MVVLSRVVCEMYRNQNIIERAVKHGVRRAALLSVLLLLSVSGYGQSEYFTYEDEEKTIISGLTSVGETATELTIPKEVNTVKSGAFSSDYAHVSALMIEDGGNPTFESGLFGTRGNPLSDIQILGSSMTAENIRTLFTSLGSQGALSTVYIAGYSGEWTDIAESSVLTSAVSVTLPAAKVSTQQFGKATVCGRFIINKEIISFCTSATFMDIDTGSNMLFYVADDMAEDGRLHISRVKYIVAGRGVLIHRSEGISGYADLERKGDIDSDGTDQANTDKALYDKNMLIGVTTATAIAATDGTKTNYVLKDGAFHPTTGGTIGANKAYLQIPTTAASSARLDISFDEEETGIRPIPSTSLNEGEWYDLQGRKVEQPVKGLYITNGKKHLVR